MKIYKNCLFMVLFAIGLNAQEECLRFGVIPYEEITDLKRNFSKWHSYVEEKIGRCVELKFAKNYSQTIIDLKDLATHCTRIGPFSYVLAKKEVDIEPLVVGVKEDGSYFYSSYLLASKKIAGDFNITKKRVGLEGMMEIVERIKDRQDSLILSFVDIGSTSGYAVPKFYLAKAGIDRLEEFKKILFLGTHDSSILGVNSKLSDLAFGNNKSFNKLLKQNKIDLENLTLIWESDPIIDSPIVCKKEMNSELKKSFKEALLSMPKEYIPKHDGVVKYKEIGDDDYKIIENIQKFLDGHSI